MSDEKTIAKGMERGRDKGYLQSLLGSYNVSATYPKSKGTIPANPWPMAGEKPSKKAVTQGARTHIKRAGEDSATPQRDRTEKFS